MKTKILILIFTKAIMTISNPTNAQQISNNPLSAMKDSFPEFVSRSDDEIILDTSIECPVINYESRKHDYISCDALGTIYKMTQQVRANLESERVRIANADKQDRQVQKKAGSAIKKQKA